MGIVGGGLTAFFNICTADWNVRDKPDTDPELKSLFSRNVVNQKKPELIPDSIWDVLDSGEQAILETLFTTNCGNNDFPILHLSCHWGAPPPDKRTTDKIRALRRLDDDLTAVNLEATKLLLAVSLQQE